MYVCADHHIRKAVRIDVGVESLAETSRPHPSVNHHNLEAVRNQNEATNHLEW
jgi:hypothetical protein